MSGQNNALLPPPQPVSFTVEHFDPVGRVTNTYVLTYFSDGRLQMVYKKARKAFLSKTYVKEISPVDLYVGNTIVVFSRHLSIVGYANESTRRYFESRQTRAFVLVKLPPATTGEEETSLGEVVTALQHGDGSGGGEQRKVLGNRSPPAVITRAEMFLCCRHMGHRGRPEALASWMEDVFPLHQTGNVVALEILVDSTNGGFQGLLGVIDRLRRRYNQKIIFASSNPQEAAEHVRYVFDERGLTPPASPAAITRGLDWNNTDGSERACTLCVVKPHVIRQGGLGVVLSLIAQHGFKVARLQMLSLSDAEADELLLPYQGVISYHREALRHLKSGPCVALKIEGGSNVVEEFRETCGPADPEVAKELRPHSIRAVLGEQQVTNAVHCTDLPEDGLLECRFMFDIIASRRHF